MFLQQLTNGGYQITGCQPTAQAAFTLARSGVQPNSQSRGFKRFHALGQQGPQQTAEHIAETSTGHG